MRVYGIVIPAIVGAFLILGVHAQYCQKCGYSGNCCTSDEECEESVNGGTCYKRHDKVDCGTFFYCYKPTTCCGVGSCCPAGSRCCGMTSCCPEGSTCCGMISCCGDDANCEDGLCVAKSSFAFQWWYVVIVVAPLLTICGFVCRRMRYSNRARAQAPRPIVLSNPSTFSANAPYPRAASTPVIGIVSDGNFAPPPRYDEISNVNPMGGANDENGVKVSEPPPYNEVTGVNTSAKDSSEETSQAAANSPQAVGNVNSAYEADRA